MRQAHPFLFLVGYRICRVGRESLAKTVDICRELSVPFREVRIAGESAELLIPFFCLRRLKNATESQNIALTLVSSHGIPALLLRYRHRYGLFLALVLSVVLTVLASGVIWDIRIDGENRLSEREVREVLGECGLELGTPTRLIDSGVLENRVLIVSDEISWISVNIVGTVAEVEIREIDFSEEDAKPTAPSNLVAAQHGKIVALEDISGNISVEIGEEVAEGQLLIGGIYGDEENGFRYVSPRGRVIAEVERSFELEISRVQSEKVYKKEQKCEKSLIFFKKRIKFFSNYRNLPPTCDKIDIEAYLPAPNGKYLPIGIHDTRYLEYEISERELSDEELSALAYEQMSALIATELADAELLRRTTECELYPDRAVIKCKVKCLTDIAIAQKIEVS